MSAYSDSDTEPESPADVYEWDATEFAHTCDPRKPSSDGDGGGENLASASDVLHAMQDLRSLDLKSVEHDTSMQDIVQRAYTTILAFLECLNRSHHHPSLDDDVAVCMLLSRSFILLLFEFRRVFRGIAVRDVAPGRAAATVVCWVDVVLAKLGDAIVSIAGGSPGGKDREETLPETLRKQRDGDVLRAATQLPAEWNAVASTLSNNSASPASEAKNLLSILTTYVERVVSPGSRIAMASGIPDLHQRCSDAILLLLFITADRAQDQNGRSTYRPCTHANLLRLIRRVMCPVDTDFSENHLTTPCPALDTSQTIMLRWGWVLSWCWSSWDDPRLADIEVIDYMAATWLYHIGDCLNVKLDGDEDDTIESWDDGLSKTLVMDSTSSAFAVIRLMHHALSLLLASPPIYPCITSQDVLYKLCWAAAQLLRDRKATYDTTLASELCSALCKFYVLLRHDDVGTLIKDVIIRGLSSAPPELLRSVMEDVCNDTRLDVWVKFEEAPVVKWNQGTHQSQDRWSRTYVTKDKSPSQPATVANDAADEIPIVPASSSASPTKRFPRPASATYSPSVAISSRVSAHIASATNPRPPSPLKQSTSLNADDAPSASANAAEGILPSPHGSELAKVYGSILQPKETLATYHCAICTTPFPPDATIYPDPSSLSSTDLDGLPAVNTRFLCRSCFTTNGGSKGECPTCNKPVLILKNEGGYIQNGGQYWHKKCFCCAGCSKNIGERPMVDLLGRPSCPDCFESCLSRSTKDDTRRRGTTDEDVRSNLGGTKRTDREREGSPALEELEQRLGIFRSRESTPIKEERPAPRNAGLKSPTTTPTARSPLPTRYTPRATESSPIVERLAARARADSFTSIGASPIMRIADDERPGMQSTQRLTSSESETPTKDADSPLAARLRYRSPEPNPSSSDGSPLSRRTYTRLKSPEPDVFGSSPVSKVSGSPRYGSPGTPIRPTEDAIEEMKQRFLRQASPSPGPSKSTIPPPSNATTPTKPTRRSTSRPRRSQTTEGTDELGTILSSFNTPSRESIGLSRIPRASLSPPLRSSPSAPLPHTTLQRSDTDAVPDYTLRRDRTGDAEVESLLGDMPGVVKGDLIDLSDVPLGHQLPQFESSGSMSMISNVPTVHAPLPSVPTRIDLNVKVGKRSSSLEHSYEHSVPSTPDLAGDFSDSTSTTPSSAPPTPPSISPPARRISGNAPNASKRSVRTHVTGDTARSPRTSDAHFTTPTPKSKTLPSKVEISSPTPLSPDTRCAKCTLPLFITKHGGKFVTVPEEPSSSGVPPKTYHTACFRCKVCDGPFEERDGGRTVFVRADVGVCHVECAPADKIRVRQVPSMIPKPTALSSTPLTTSRASNTTRYSATPTSSRYEGPPPTAPATTTTFTFPKFGGSSSCPGCHKAVAVMERGVVPGPQGTRWHAACLLCGGKEAKGRRREEGKPGCGKKLDSAAKMDTDGQVWCRECLLLLPATLRNTPSPVRSPLVASHTGSRGIAPQYTGTTTIARQFTGIALVEPDEAARRATVGDWASVSAAQVGDRYAEHEERRRGEGNVPGAAVDRWERGVQWE
ncbi:uncharacterized protein FIBRA_02956 [Fibroporia radiculosa]|uniref:LIM zinc-binding domain-containing protein n=1 Tax=Fibroporia radiculosa TaxID=599839 RepID=J4GN77_9APHY|nr:uncharacterized protein FIBRA_02956 [Fibroporia radiculosa]CCM00910.1 predicted protein [Fibroporia radiculosa]